MKATTTAADQKAVSAIYELSEDKREKLVSMIKSHISAVISSPADEIISDQLTALEMGEYVGLELVAWVRQEMELTEADLQFL